MARIHIVLLSNISNKEKIAELKQLVRGDRAQLDAIFETKEEDHKVYNRLTPLQIATIQGNFKIIKFLAKIGASCNYRRDTVHPICIAIISYKTKAFKSQDKAIVEFLLSYYKIDLSCPSNAVIAASLMETLPLVKAEEIVKINPQNPIFLYSAAMVGKVEIVKELLKRGANANGIIPSKPPTSISNQSPLIASCSDGHYEITELLVKAGANVNYIGLGDSGVGSPLKEAAKLCDCRTVIYLVLKGADADQVINRKGRIVGPLTAINTHKKHSLDILKFLLNNSKYKATETIENIPPEILQLRTVALCISYLAGRSDMAAELLKYAYDPNLEVEIATKEPVDDNGLVVKMPSALYAGGNEFYISPLIALIMSQRDFPFPFDTIVQLIPSRVDFNKAISKGRLSGVTPLLTSVAVGSEAIQITEYFLNHGADPNRVINTGPYKNSTLLNIAVANGDLPTATLLLEKGALVNQEDGNGATPLLAAMRLEKNEPNKVALIRLLLQKKANTHQLIKQYEISIVQIALSLKDIEPEVFSIFQAFEQPAPLTTTENRETSSSAKTSLATSRSTIWSSLPESIFIAPEHPPQVVRNYLRDMKGNDVLLHHAYFAMNKLQDAMRAQPVSIHQVALLILRSHEALIQYIDKYGDETICTREEASVFRNAIMHLFFELNKGTILQTGELVLNTTFILIGNRINNKQAPMTTHLAENSVYNQLLTTVKNTSEQQLKNSELAKLIFELLTEITPYLKTIDIELKLDFLAKEKDELTMKFALIGQYYRLLKVNAPAFSDFLSLFNGEVSKQAASVFFERCTALRDTVAHDFSSKKTSDILFIKIDNKYLHTLLVMAKQVFTGANELTEAPGETTETPGETITPY